MQDDAGGVAGAESTVIRPGTLEIYRSDLEHPVKPCLGRKKLTQITADDLRKLYDTLKQRAVRRHRSRHPRHTPPRAAHRRGPAAAAVYPADHLEPPRVAHKTMKILNDEQLDTFLSAVKQNPVWSGFFYTELTTDLHLGEIYGLM